MQFQTDRFRFEIYSCSRPGKTVTSCFEVMNRTRAKSQLRCSGSSRSSKLERVQAERLIMKEHASAEQQEPAIPESCSRHPDGCVCASQPRIRSPV